MKKKIKISVVVALMVIVLGSLMCVNATVGNFTLYGQISSGNWNPFTTDEARTYLYVAWYDNVNGQTYYADNYCYASTTIYWTDSNGSHSSSVSNNGSDITGFFYGSWAQSGNDNVDASAYHYGYENDYYGGGSSSSSGWTYE